MMLSELGLLDIVGSLGIVSTIGLLLFMKFMDHKPNSIGNDLLTKLMARVETLEQQIVKYQEEVKVLNTNISELKSKNELLTFRIGMMEADKLTDTKDIDGHISTSKAINT